MMRVVGQGWGALMQTQPWTTSPGRQNCFSVLMQRPGLALLLPINNTYLSDCLCLQSRSDCPSHHIIAYSSITSITSIITIAISQRSGLVLLSLRRVPRSSHSSRGCWLCGWPGTPGTCPACRPPPCNPPPRSCAAILPWSPACYRLHPTASYRMLACSGSAMGSGWTATGVSGGATALSRPGSAPAATMAVRAGSKFSGNSYPTIYYYSSLISICMSYPSLLAAFSDQPQISQIAFQSIQPIAINKMQQKLKTGSSAFTTSPSHPHSRHASSQLDPSPVGPLTVVEIANTLVDSVSALLCRQIEAGHLQVDDQERLLNIGQGKGKDEEDRVSPRTIDPEEHRRLISKFKRQSRKMREQRQMKSLEMSEKSAREAQEEERDRAELRLKSLQSRREQIERRMKEKKDLMKQISKTILETNSRVQEVKKKRFLYQDKQQQFYNNFSLPKLKAQQKILQQKKQLRNPINMTQLYTHNQTYLDQRAQKQINRSATMKLMISKDREYSPPEFVPQSYRLAEKEQNQRQMEEERRRRELGEIERRKRDYVRKLDQEREKERERERMMEKSRSKSPSSLPTKEKSSKRMGREQMINTGNQYLKELLQNNKRLARKKPPPLDHPLPSQSSTKRTSPSAQGERARQQRISQLHNLRNKKINQIIKSNQLSHRDKLQKLEYEVGRLDTEIELKMKGDNTVQQINNTAGVIINCVNAKLAILQLAGGTN